MRYLGGKSRIAKEIAQVVAPQGFWWEPFCGGLSVSVQLAKYGPGLISDANPALISLYMSVARGWLPPEAVTAEEWAAAKSLPDSDPRKAFAGIGCSYLGMWFQGYEDVDVRTIATGPQAGRSFTQRRAKAAKESLLGDVPKLSACAFRWLSFFDVDPETFPSQPETIYCDPPYAGTAGYGATGPFDHGRFWAYCLGWAARGSRVFVSELGCPVDSSVVWERAHVHRSQGTKAQPRVERLFRVHAPSLVRAA